MAPTQFGVCHFGLSGAAPNFQKAIHIILKPVIGKIVSVYMSDVIISSPSFTDKVEHLRVVFRLLQEAGLTLNKEKCKFGCDELKYLDLIIKILLVNRGAEGIRRGQGSHNESTVLKLPDVKKPFELFTDASSIGVGAVLNQEQRPVVFASRTLSNAERNYTVIERECLAVVWALNKSRTYLGSLPIKIITDHAALTRLTHDKICQGPRKKYRGDEIVMPSTSGYYLRPRRAKVEGQPLRSGHNKEDQFEPGKAKKNHYSPYIEEQASSKNTRRRSSQQ
ncbi:retrovirus-related Pol polyprotein from transposon gypsy [Trichonephila clavipes]|nr:retrovirus-related Pol polyprotein from transposon gypsy [Trichonephila clavipes]